MSVDDISAASAVIGSSTLTNLNVNGALDARFANALFNVLSTFALSSEYLYATNTNLVNINSTGTSTLKNLYASTTYADDVLVLDLFASNLTSGSSTITNLNSNRINVEQANASVTISNVLHANNIVSGLNSFFINSTTVEATSTNLDVLNRLGFYDGNGFSIETVFASSTFANFVNLFVQNSYASTTMTDNLFATFGNIFYLQTFNLGTLNATVTNATLTNATSSNFFAFNSNANFLNALISNIDSAYARLSFNDFVYATSGVFTSNLNSTGTFNLATGTIAMANVTSLNAGTSTFAGLVDFSNSTVTFSTSTIESLLSNVVSTTTVTNNFFATNTFATNTFAVNSTVQNATISFATVTNATITNLQSQAGNFGSVTTENAYLTSIFGTNLTSSLASFTSSVFAPLAYLTDLYSQNIYASTTNSSTTNSLTVNASTSNFVTTNTTNLNSELLNATSANIANISTTTIASATINSLFANSLSANGLSIFNGTLDLTNSSVNFATSTIASILGNVVSTTTVTNNFFATNTFATNTFAVNSTVQNATISFATLTNSTSTNIFTQNFSSQNSSITNSTTTNFFTNVFATLNGQIDNLTTTNSTLTNATVTNIVLANSTSTNLFASNLVTNIFDAVNASIDSLTSELLTTNNLLAINATLTNATTTNLFTNGLTATGTNKFFGTLDLSNASITFPTEFLNYLATFATGTTTATTTVNNFTINSGLTLQNSTTSTTTNTLYNVDGVLYFNGLPVGTTTVVNESLSSWKISGVENNLINIGGLVFGNGKFVLTGQYDYSGIAPTENVVLMSIDGISWTKSTTSTLLSSLSFSNGRFFANNTSGRMLTSTNGTDWNVVNNITTSGFVINAKAVVFGASTYVAVGITDKYYRSNNGLDWQEFSFNPTFDINAITFGAGKFVGVGANKAVYSVDGITWNYINGFPTFVDAKNIAYGDKFVATGAGGRFLTSLDGITWTVSLSTGQGTTSDVVYSGSEYIAVINKGEGDFTGVSHGGRIGVVNRSVDGLSWSSEPVLVTNRDWSLVEYGNGVLVAVANGAGYDGYKNRVIYSTDIGAGSGGGSGGGGGMFVGGDDVVIGSGVATSLAATTTTFVNSTITNATVTNLSVENFVSNIFAGNFATFTNATITNSTITNATVTNLNSNTFSFGTGQLASTSIANANITNSFVSNFTSLLATLASLVFENATGTNLQLANATATNIVATGTLFASELNLGNGSSSSFYVDDFFRAMNGTIDEFVANNATITNLVFGSIVGATGQFADINSTNITATGTANINVANIFEVNASSVNATSSNIENLYASTTLFDDATISGTLFADILFANTIANTGDYFGVNIFADQIEASLATVTQATFTRIRADIIDTDSVIYNNGGIEGQRATITSATITNVFASSLFGTFADLIVASTTNLRFVNLEGMDSTITNATSTNLYSSNIFSDGEINLRGKVNGVNVFGDQDGSINNFGGSNSTLNLVGEVNVLNEMNIVGTVNFAGTTVFSGSSDFQNDFSTIANSFISVNGGSEVVIGNESNETTIQSGTINIGVGTGTIPITSTINLGSASATINAFNFNADVATVTNSTSTSLFTEFFRSLNANIDNLVFDSAVGNTLQLGTLNVTDINATGSVVVNQLYASTSVLDEVTSTNLFASVFDAVNGFIDGLTFNNATGNNLQLASLFTTNLTATGTTNISNLFFDLSTGSQATITNLYTDTLTTKDLNLNYLRLLAQLGEATIVDKLTVGSPTVANFYKANFVDNVPGTTTGSAAFSMTNLASLATNTNTVLRLNSGAGNGLDCGVIATGNGSTTATGFGYSDCAKFLDFYASAADENSGENVGRIAMINSGLANRIGYFSGGADFGEILNLYENPEYGDIVGFDENGYVKAKPGIRLVGVVSDNTAFIGNMNAEQGENARTVGYVGIVRTFVSTENGEIRKGDPIGLGTVPGVGVKMTKAGYIIGHARESYSGTGVGKVEVQVDPTWYDPDILQLDSFINNKLSSSISSSTNTLTNNLNSSLNNLEGSINNNLANKINSLIDTRVVGIMESILQDGNTKLATSSVNTAIDNLFIEYFTVSTTTEQLNVKFAATSTNEEGVLRIDQFSFVEMQNYVLESINKFNKVVDKFNNNVLTVAEVVADKLIAKEVKTDKLCIGETCISESELKEILQAKTNPKANTQQLTSVDQEPVTNNNQIPTTTAATTSVVETLPLVENGETGGTSTTSDSTAEGVTETPTNENVDNQTEAVESAVN